MNDREHDAEFAKLLEETRRLPRSIEPPRDLWPGIAARMRRRPAWLRWSALAAAAAVVLVVGWRVLGGRGAGWVVARVDGGPRIGGTALAGTCGLGATAGSVGLQGGGRASVVPLGARGGPAAGGGGGGGPGTPFVEDAPAELREALTAFDFERGGAASVRTVLRVARAQDAVTLWHLVSRVDPPLRAAVYDRLAALVPPPPGTSRDAAPRLDPPTLQHYGEHRRRIQWRRMILQGIREIDPRTGTGRAVEGGRRR